MLTRALSLCLALAVGIPSVSVSQGQPRLQTARREVLILVEPGAIPSSGDSALPSFESLAMDAGLRAAMRSAGVRRIRRAVTTWPLLLRAFPDARVYARRRGELMPPDALADLSHLYVLELSDSGAVRWAISVLGRASGVVYAHENGLIAASLPLSPFAPPSQLASRPTGFGLFRSLDGRSAMAPGAPPPDLYPNDPLFVSGQNWGFFGWNGSANAPQAWGIQTGRDAVKIGILDTGIDINHTDMWNGGTPRVAGMYDFVHDDSDAFPDLNIDHPNHGMAVAGIAAAHTNDGFGSAGLCGGNGPQNTGCRVLAAKVLGDGSVINGIAEWLAALSQLERC